MTRPSSQLTLTDTQKRRLSLPGIFVGVTLCFGMILYGWLFAETESARLLNIFSGFFGVIYTIVFFYFLLPGSRPGRIDEWLFVLANGIIVGWVYYIEPVSLPNMTLLLLFTLLLMVAVVTNRIATYAFIGFALVSIAILPGWMGDTSRTIQWTFPVMVILIGIATNEIVVTLKRNVLTQINRLETVNRMTRNLASSIETSNLVDIMSFAIQTAFEADTYYIGFLKGSIIKLDLFYDEGKFYDGLEVELKDSLTGWVVQHRQPLLLGNVPQDLARIGLRTSLIGSPKISLSWMGVPVYSSENLFGIVAVASYTQNAFNRNDMELLENFARQSATALDNARHHEEAVERSRLDSLTNALNHGSFIQSVQEALRQALKEGWPVSLIMLDIDHFKKYNDTYGHLIGDQVLIGLTGAIREHIKNTDLVGRWGGEEFVIALPHSNGAQAIRVAQRIRLTLQELHLVDRNDQLIPPPTISQGIAVFPQDCDQAYPMIDLADQRLYIAKARGRDQVEPTQDIWDSPAVD